MIISIGRFYNDQYLIGYIRLLRCFCAAAGSVSSLYDPGEAIEP